MAQFAPAATEVRNCWFVRNPSGHNRDDGKVAVPVLVSVTLCAELDVRPVGR